MFTTIKVIIYLVFVVPIENSGVKQVSENCYARNCTLKASCVCRMLALKHIKLRGQTVASVRRESEAANVSKHRLTSLAIYKNSTFRAKGFRSKSRILVYTDSKGLLSTVVYSLNTKF